jgi:hypothetical protein
MMADPVEPVPPRTAKIAMKEQVAMRNEGCVKMGARKMLYSRLGAEAYHSNFRSV